MRRDTGGNGSDDLHSETKKIEARQREEQLSERLQMLRTQMLHRMRIHVLIDARMY
jgi:hypothetical protein